MPITVEQDHQRRRLIARAVGVLVPAELFDFVRVNRSGELARYQLLFDATSATAHAQPPDVQRLADQVTRDAAHMGGVRGPVAIVANDDLLHLAQMYEALCVGAGLHVIRVFQQVAEAKRWLGW